MLKNINDVASKATAIGNLVTELLISIAIIYMVYNIVRYFIADGEGDRGKAGMNILYGVVGLFVILSIWGLVSLLTGTFRFQDNQRPPFESIVLPSVTNTGRGGYVAPANNPDDHPNGFNGGF